ncbi:MAG: hypothetical protein HYV09_07850 [Deltaproteobacteria bacterium]|nr:hypothetical protein [Deltaproteobacteria bacterium]
MASQKSSRGSGCLGSGIVILVTAAVLGKCVCGRDAKEQASAPNEPAKPVPQPVAKAAVSSAAGASGSASAAPASAFDALWRAATSPPPKQNFDQVFALVLSQADYCATHDCGDEFTREQRYKDAKEAAKKIRAATWRTTLPAEKVGLLSGREGFAIGEFNPARVELPIVLEWPRALGGKLHLGGPAGDVATDCAPRRPGIERLMMPNGEANNSWVKFKTTELAVKFASVDEAKAWKQRSDNPALLQLVFRITDQAVDIRKTTQSGVTLDSGAGGLAIVQVLGARLLDGSRVLAGKPTGPAPTK